MGVWRWIAWAGVGLAVWIGYPSPPGDLRRFNPDAVAAAETAMWRSYYEGERILLFFQLTGLLRVQFGKRTPHAFGTAYHAARAAAIFQPGRNRAEYQRALPELVFFYRRVLPTGAPVDRIAELELEWWIAHRERSAALKTHLAALQGVIYGKPVARFAEHAALRAQAMRLRDEKASAIRDADWVRIGELLRDSWRSLHGAAQ